MWAAMSPDNNLVASVAWDGTARVWDARSGLCLHILGPFGGQLWSGAFSMDQRYLAFSQGNPKSYVHVYDIDSEQPVSCFAEFHRAAHSLSWRHDGTMLAGGADEGTLCIWDPYTGEERMRWCLAFDDILIRRFATTRAAVYKGSGRQDRDMPYFRNGLLKGLSNLVVVPDMDGFLRIWDI